jgi:hypothetical protein
MLDFDLDEAPDRPPHFPDPNVNPIAVLETRCAELDEQLAAAHKEAKAWQAQLESALARLDALEGRGLPPTSSNLGHG